MGLEGKGGDGENRGEVPEMGFRCGKGNTRIHDKGGGAKGKIKDEGGKESMGVREEAGERMEK